MPGATRAAAAGPAARGRRRGPLRGLAATAVATVLALTAGGCVTVHGELAVVPSASRAEAARALKDFTESYNASNAAYDPALNAGRVTGALGAINQAGLKARSVTQPGGNPRHKPLILSDAAFTIPKKAGWPRWFLADATADQGSGPSTTSRWAVVFVRNGPQQLWEAAYLQVLARDELPKFRTDADGWAVPVAADAAEPAVAPRELSREYVSYLRTGRPEHFAAGPETSAWREKRRTTASRPGLSTQYVDQPLDSGDFAPLGLATEDGGALVFFATRYFDRQTAAAGFRPRTNAEVRALTTGQVKSTLTKEWVSSQVARVAPAGARQNQVTVLNRIQGVVAAKGS
ncbi:hypothetical protein NX801_25535 [Streptomyces sp. LP05-1]|uniref:DUF8094 domain-containing protein n=2 Tax=Streptomyces pyxinae TaxID=2970734 RepID=A0ABT2CND1_9ACTN|nr:hypothetical protein [Streptomyces sp. LP05-1]